jgi:hypothetical protein
MGSAMNPTVQRRLFQSYDQFLPDSHKGRPKDFFVYSAEFTPLGASTTSSFTISIQADSDFLILAGVRVVTDTGNTTFVSNVPQLVTITDTGAGRTFMDRAVHMDNLFGTAQLPALWPYPKFVQGASALSVTLQNLDATARNVRLSFLGFKIF